MFRSKGPNTKEREQLTCSEETPGSPRGLYIHFNITNISNHWIGPGNLLLLNSLIFRQKPYFLGVSLESPSTTSQESFVYGTVWAPRIRHACMHSMTVTGIGLFLSNARKKKIQTISRWPYYKMYKVFQHFDSSQSYWNDVILVSFQSLLLLKSWE